MASMLQKAARNAVSYALFGPRNAGYRSSLENPQTPLSFPAEWLLDMFNGGRSDSGIRVSEMTALQVSTVLACCNIITNGLSTVPLLTYERETIGLRSGKKVATDHPLYHMLRKEPNPEMSSHTFRKTIQLHMLLWGNGYAEIQYNQAGQIIALWPRNPARTRPIRLLRDMRFQGDTVPAGTLVYKSNELITDQISAEDTLTTTTGSDRFILAEDMLHMPGLSLDGRVGQSTIWLTRQVIGLALATEKYGAKFFGNGAVPRGILEIPNALEPKAIEELRRQWHEAHGGENIHKLAVLEAGMKYTPIGVDADKAQLIATRQYQRTEIASFFNVPAHMVGEATSRGATVEQVGIEFLTYCLNPWIDIWEQELERKLFPDKGRMANRNFAKFDTRKMRYPDADSRSKLYTAGRTGGFLTANDIRDIEDMNPLPGKIGEAIWMPINMQDASDPTTLGANAAVDFDKTHGTNHSGINPPPPTVVHAPAPGGTPPTGGGSAPAKGKASIDAYSAVYRTSFRDAFGRIAHRSDANAVDISRILRPTLTTLVELLIADKVAMTGQPGVTSPELAKEMNTYLASVKERLDNIKSDEEVTVACQYFYNAVNGNANPQVRAAGKAFYIGRHGVTQDDVDGLWSGWDAVPLTEQGIADVTASANSIKSLGIKRIVTSPIARCKQTAAIYSQVLGNIPVEEDARLSALNLGMLAKQKESIDVIQPYVDDQDAAIPGGESINAYRTRLLAGVQDAKDKNQSTGPTLLLTHSSGIAMVEGGGNIAKASGVLKPGSVAQLVGKKLNLLTGSTEPDGSDAA